MQAVMKEAKEQRAPGDEQKPHEAPKPKNSMAQSMRK